VWGVVFQGRSTEGFYGLANISQLLGYNGRFKEYKGLYGIATDFIKKKNEITLFF